MDVKNDWMFVNMLWPPLQKQDTTMRESIKQDDMYC